MNAHNINLFMDVLTGRVNKNRGYIDINKRGPKSIRLVITICKNTKEMNVNRLFKLNLIFFNYLV